MTYKTEGIIIKRMNFKEADLLLTILTPERGKIAVIAKGARRIRSKVSGALELFYVGNFMLAEGKTFDVLCAAEAKARHLFLRTDLEKLGRAYYLAEIADRFLQEGDSNADIYRELLKAVGAIENKGDLPVRIFELRILNILGFGPELESCVACRGPLREGHCALSKNHGGTVCEKCADHDPDSFGVSDNAVKLMRLMLKFDYEVVFRVSGSEDLVGVVGRFSEGYLERILQRPLKTRKFISKIAAFAA